MKKLLFAIAGAASFAALAADPATGRTGDISWVGFENYTADQTVLGYEDSGVPGTGLWSYTGEQNGDASLVKTYSGDNAAKGNGLTFPAPFEDEGDKYLALDTNGAELQRAVGAAAAADGTYIDTLVQFTPSESAPTSTDLAGAKLAIWLGVENNVTNLYVQGNLWDFGESPVPTSQAYALTGKTIEPGTWYRLTVKAIPNILGEGSGMAIPAFQICVDGTEMTLASAAFTAAFQEVLEQSSMYASAEIATAVAAKKLVPAVQAEVGTYGDALTLTSVGFKGTGAIDDFVVTTEAPDFTPAAIDFSLTWPSGLTASYKIGEGEVTALTGTSAQIQVPVGSAVQLYLQNADGATKTLSVASASAQDNAIDASAATFTWADYLGDAVDGAYEIDDLAELKLFQKGVANTNELTTANTTFKLTADIALTAAWEGIGIKAGKDLVNGSTKDIPAYEAGAFCGTFDGQNHTISNFQMENGTDYGAFFNSVNGALISNLKISFKENKLCADSSATGGDTGAAFVGVARFSTLQNLTALATQDVDTVSASKDMAGIVAYLMAGSTVDSCTNELNVASLLTAKARKSGGIALITQDGTGTATIQNCKNSGTVTLANAGGQSGGIVGYVGQSTTIIDCENTAAVKMLTIMGSASLTVQGTNKGNATVASCNVATNGLNFATVDGDVATFVADDALALNGAYKVMTTGATATFAFAEAGTIAFDTALFTPTYAITAAEGLDLTDATVGTVTTYTAAAQQQPGDDYVVEIEGSDVVITPQAGDLEALAGAGVDTNSVAAVNAALATEIGTTGIPAWQALFLGVAPTEAGLESFKIDSIKFNSDGTVTVALPTNVEPKAGRGVDITIKLMKADAPNAAAADWTLVESADGKTFAPFAPGSTDTKKFYKVVVEFAGSQN